ncbi:MAG TPA: 16S rRNA (cytosine(967)-C(5))-methyltransferase RsmB [Gammaproteobacteria bacterium]|nr:16S rRNA (cytosine(967)-C(5))-methyltransferase RsmB [Gammaproteobacteria bacterium]
MNAKAKAGPRGAAVQALTAVLARGRSLTAALPPALAALGEGRDRAQAQALAYGVLRWYPRLDAILAQLLQRPLRNKDIDVRCALLIGLYEVLYQRTPDHAGVSEAVGLAGRLGKPWARGLVNGVLRSFLREREAIAARADGEAAARLAHPAWLLDALRADWPDRWEAIAAANNEPPPMTLRVNARRDNRDSYLEALTDAGLPARPHPHAPMALTLDEPCPVEALPGFAEGRVSVQDAAAQLAAELLDPQPGERVLDACAAPGGKSAHILERQPELGELVALDVDPDRLTQVEQTLQRLGLVATVRAGDAAEPASWWDGRPFDRILLDAPCSATGVIRRHPDIKVLRRASDIDALVERQRCIIKGVWSLLRPGGILIYATCSVLRRENAAQISDFLRQQADAAHRDIAATWGHAADAGRQVLPGEDGMDGFFYACLQKQ